MWVIIINMTRATGDLNMEQRPSSTLGSDADDCIDFLFVHTSEMRQLLHLYPEILFVDATYRINNVHYPLYLIEVEDGYGLGEVVAFCFVKHETVTYVRKMFSVLLDFVAQQVIKNVCLT